MRGLALACILLVLLPGCSHPAPRDPGAVPLAEGKGGVLGYVRIHDDHQEPVAGADVLILPGGGYLTTDDVGGFVLRNMNPGHYQAQVQKSGYEAAPVEFDVKAGQYAEIHVLMDPRSNR